MENPGDILSEFQIQPPPQEDRPEDPKKVLQLARKFPEFGETIQKLAGNRWFVNSEANLLDLADDLNDWPAIQAVGVVETNGKISGIIVRQDLFDLLGRPFGRDVLIKENVARVAQSVKPFFNDTSIFSVSDEIGKSGLHTETRYFPLRTGVGEFAGIFSTQDLLIHLSEMTQNDITLARSIQTKIVRESILIENIGFDLVSSSTMAKGVGGDFYHVIKYENNKWAFCICDVSEKGVAASLVTCSLWGVMQAYDFRGGIRSLVERLNRFFISTFGLEKYATGIFADFDPTSGSMLICDQGHGHGYIIRKGKLLKIKTSEKSFPIGVSPDLKPDLFRYQLLPGDVVLMLSDGFVEQKNRAGDSFGLIPIKKIMESHGTESLKTIKRRLLEEFHAFRGSTPQYDDITFIILRYK